MCMGYVRLSQAAKHLSVCTRTLIRWEAAGKIKVDRSPGGKRIYDLNSLERTSYIYVRCPVTNRRMTSAARRSICLTNIPDTQLLVTLDPALTSRGKDFYRFWNRAREDMYRRLWLPLKIDCVVLDSIYLHGRCQARRSPARL
jgi:hypothetical protein